MDNPNVKIIVATHKQSKMPSDEIYLPLHVGAEGKVNKDGTAVDFGFQKDNTGDNISKLNWCFGTQTALYWAWKNLAVDYTGLVHYRRYFLNRKPKKGEDPFYCILTKDQLLPLLARYRVIVPKKRHYYIESVYSHYSHTMNGGKEQFDLTRKIIEEKTPEYLESFDKVMRGTSAYIFNMMILEKSLFDEYCCWLFTILFELFERYDLSGLSDFDKRYAGRVSERLFNVWLNRQIDIGKLKKTDIKELPYTEDVNWRRKITGFIQAKLFKKKYGSSF
ncbi:MAG: DUF4422 domain-containing protein [Clostridia bacterium]|nr:DUF4422 domain-containing protein [Clostridia bacterium]